jgi:branched-chain amino acid transport system substrate-binding protein
MRVSKRARWALVIVAAAALVLAAAAAARTGSTAAKKPIVIGWDADFSGVMKPFDAPPLAAAELRVAQIDKKGGVMGQKLVIKTCDTQNDKAAVAKSCADKLIGEGAKIIFVTCDVDRAAPAVEESLKHHLLTIAPCIGTDQMGPKRFGKPGALAFSFGNVAQDEGSAMAQLAWQKGWHTADLATDNVIVYFKAVMNAFKARFQQLGGKIVYSTTYQDSAYGGNNVQNAVTGINAHPARVVVTCTAGAYGSLAPFVTGIRTAANNTPVLDSWAADGTYWLPQSPKVTNFWYVTYANAFGHDPSKAVSKVWHAINPHPGLGSFVTGPAAIDGVIVAIERAHGSLVGSKLAAVMQKFHDVPTLSGKVSFSKKFHSVFGRAYRVIEIQNNVPIARGEVTAKVVPNSSD